MLMSVESVAAMQKVAAVSNVCPSVPGCPVRVMLPPPLVGKQGIVVLFEQQSCEMPPLASMQLPAASVPAQAAPVQVAVQLPVPQLSSWLCPGHGFGPTSGVASSVANGSWMSSPVGAESPSGTQSLDSS
jgi:hypothetical protein